ncbi:MAG TPA: isochorismatase [Anaerolineae bacterium]|nr:isochorismatase [Anaerolineae bacterium]HIQ08337.1 isochorismatase [Anaerolineaceae bacterium]
MPPSTLPVPPHFDPERVGKVWKVDYEARAREARAWAQQHAIPPAAQDSPRIALVLIDLQNTFCLPDFELFVAGRSGHGAVEDNIRLCRFIYQNLHHITHIVATLDTHLPMQIFHAPFLVDAEGNHPAPFTMISAEDVAAGRWRFNPHLAPVLGLTPEEGQAHLEHYVRTLAQKGKYQHTIWPFHAMLGGIGHALVPAVEEAVFFHSIARYAQPEHIIKGNHPLTEHYSALGPEVNTDPHGHPLVPPNERLVQLVKEYDAVIITGQAKSHCVAWTVNDLLDTLEQRGQGHLARRIYLLEDTTSPVVVPGADFTDAADEAYARFARRGAHRVTTEQPLDTWGIA